MGEINFRICFVPLSIHKKTGPPLRRRFYLPALLLFVLYLVVLFKLLFFKITLNVSDIAITSNDNSSFKILLADSNFIPFYRIWYYASGSEPYEVGALNVFGNILLFVPMGAGLPFFFKGINSAGRLVAITFLLSLLIETLQLFTVTGQFDIDDVLLNTLGAALGYAFFIRMLKPVAPLNNSNVFEKHCCCLEPVSK